MSDTLSKPFFNVVLEQTGTNGKDDVGAPNTLDRLNPGSALNGSSAPELSTLLDDVCTYFKRYVVFPLPGQPIVIALWAVHTWALDAFDYTPYLHPFSPEKQCGKSRVLDCLELVTPKAWRAISPSEAVLFREIERDRPTLLLDEVDALFSNGKDDRKESLRALLNAGFERRASVPRCVPQGNTFTVQRFAVFCAKAFAGIGKLPDTISDRCIPIRLIRKSRDESVERFRKRDAEAVAAPIAAALEAWSKGEGQIETLRASRPSIPDELSDRQADICEPLLAIADLAGGEWPDRARKALASLCAANENEDDSLGVKLLSAIRDIFEADGNPDRFTTAHLLEQLVDQETDAPWPGWWEHDVKGDKIRGPAAKLARLLKPFNIRARAIRVPDNPTARGYLLDDFEEAWKRYCPPRESPKDVTMLQNE